MYSAVLRRASSIHPEYDVQTAPKTLFNMMEYFSSLLSNPVRLMFFCFNFVCFMMFARWCFSFYDRVSTHLKSNSK